MRHQFYLWYTTNRSHFIALSNSGFSRTVRMWLESYLPGHERCVSVGGCQFTTVLNTNEVNQVSILRPLLYLIFTTPIGKLIWGFRVSYHRVQCDGIRFLTHFAMQHHWQHFVVCLRDICIPSYIAIWKHSAWTLIVKRCCGLVFKIEHYINLGFLLLLLIISVCWQYADIYCSQGWPWISTLQVRRCCYNMAPKEWTPGYFYRKWRPNATFLQWIWLFHI